MSLHSFSNFGKAPVVDHLCASQSLIGCSNAYAVLWNKAPMMCNGMNMDTSNELFNSLVCICQGVTLGGTGKDAGDRHPKIQEGVLIGAGATILGNIVVGRGAMVAAGSLVLKDVPAHRWVLAYVYAYFPCFFPLLVAYCTLHTQICRYLQYGGWNSCESGWLFRGIDTF